MKLSNTSKSYVERQIKAKAQTKIDSLLETLEGAEAENAARVEEAKKKVVRILSKAVPEIKKAFEALGLTWLDHEYGVEGGKLSAVSDANMPFLLDIDVCDFAETASATDHSFDKKVGKWVERRLWAREDLQECQSALDDMSEKVNAEIEKAVFAIETSKCARVELDSIVEKVEF